MLRWRLLPLSLGVLPLSLLSRLFTSFTALMSCHIATGVLARQYRATVNTNLGVFYSSMS